ncbi:hypothetical protein [Melittangium boletus]|nr:hypothetical protein [Melittangium boletus]
MSDMKWAHSLVVAFMIQGCEGQPVEAGAAMEPASGQAGGKEAAASPPEQDTAAGSSQAEWHGCRYTLSHEERPDGGQPSVPIYDIILHRSNQGTCPWGGQSRLLGSSYEVPAFSLVAGPWGIGVGHIQVNARPSLNPPPVHFSLRHVAPDTLEPLRNETLTASICPRGMGTCLPGRIHQAELALTEGTLVVKGTKSGSIPGEIGEGTQFTATYPHFFTTRTSPTVLAPPDENGSYASIEWSGCHFFVWAIPTDTWGQGNAGEHAIYLTRMPYRRECPWGMESKLIERTYRPGPLALVGGMSGLAVGYKRQQSASDAAPVSLRILQLTWNSLQAAREESLEVRKDEGGRGRPGSISLVHLSITRNEALVVLGHKDGAFVGEKGSPSHFQVSFEDFFTSTRPPTFGDF